MSPSTRTEPTAPTTISFDVLYHLSRMVASQSDIKIIPGDDWHGDHEFLTLIYPPHILQSLEENDAIGKFWRSAKHVKISFSKTDDYEDTLDRIIDVETMLDRTILHPKWVMWLLAAAERERVETVCRREHRGLENNYLPVRGAGFRGYERQEDAQNIALATMAAPTKPAAWWGGASAVLSGLLSGAYDNEPLPEAWNFSPRLCERLKALPQAKTYDALKKEFLRVLPGIVKAWIQYVRKSTDPDEHEKQSSENGAPSDQQDQSSDGKSEQNDNSSGESQNGDQQQSGQNGDKSQQGSQNGDQEQSGQNGDKSQQGSQNGDQQQSGQNGDKSQQGSQNGSESNGSQQQSSSQSGSESNGSQQQSSSQSGSESNGSQQQSSSQSGSQSNGSQQQSGSQGGSQSNGSQQQSGSQGGSQSNGSQQQSGSQSGSQPNGSQQQSGSQSGSKPNGSQEQPGSQNGSQGDQQQTGSFTRKPGDDQSKNGSGKSHKSDDPEAALSPSDLANIPESVLSAIGNDAQTDRKTPIIINFAGDKVEDKSAFDQKHGELEAAQAAANDNQQPASGAGSTYLKRPVTERTFHSWEAIKDTCSQMTVPIRRALSRVRAEEEDGAIQRGHIFGRVDTRAVARPDHLVSDSPFIRRLEPDEVSMAAAIIVDTSVSMRAAAAQGDFMAAFGRPVINRTELAQRFVIALTEELQRHKAAIGVYRFDTCATRLLEFKTSLNADDKAKVITRLTPDGSSTLVAEVLSQALTHIKDVKRDRKFVFVLTDGQFSSSESSRIKALVNEYRKSSVTLIILTMGCAPTDARSYVGDEYADELTEQNAGQILGKHVLRQARR